MWSKSDYPINPESNIQGLDVNLKQLFKMFSVDYDNPSKPLIFHCKNDYGYSYCFRKRRGRIYITSRPTRKSISVDWLIWIMTRGIVVNQSESRRVIHLDRNSRNHHPSNLAFCFSSPETLPDYLCDIEPSKTLPRAIQWNNKLNIWQVLFLRNGRYLFLGLFPSFSSAQKAYQIACLQLGIISYQERERSNIYNSLSYYDRKGKPVRTLKRIVNHLEQEITQPKQPISQSNYLTEMVDLFREYGEL